MTPLSEPAIARNCSRYSVQPGHVARCRSSRSASAAGQRALEVVGHELDHLDAGGVLGVAMDRLVGHQSESVSFSAVSAISCAVTAS